MRPRIRCGEPHGRGKHARRNWRWTEIVPAARRKRRRRDRTLRWFLRLWNRRGLRVSLLRIAGLLGVSILLRAQPPEVPPKREVVVVTGSYEPIPLEEAERSVRSIDVKDL